MCHSCISGNSRMDSPSDWRSFSTFRPCRLRSRRSTRFAARFWPFRHNAYSVPVAPGRSQSFKWWLLPHALAGACALFLGPMQFSDRLRLRYTKLHRVVGRVYVAGVLIAAPLGAFIQYRFDERLGVSRSFTIATIVDASLWMLTTAIALVFALNGRIQQHRQWMTRSYAVAIVFLESRVIA